MPPARFSPSSAAKAPVAWRSVVAPIAVALGGLWAYHDCFQGAFVFDDLPTIVENPAIRHLWPWGRPSSGAVTLTVGGRPVADFTLALNHAIGGLDPRGYHLFNLIVHLLAGLTLYGVVRRTLARGPGDIRAAGSQTSEPSVWLAMVVALIWTVHPLQTEAVTYIVQRTESLMGLFYLLTLYCFIRYVDPLPGRSGPLGPPVGPGGPSGPALPCRPGDPALPSESRSPVNPWAGLSIACCFLGMATKEGMVTAPIIVLLYDRTFFTGSFAAAWRRRRAYYLGLAASWLPLAVLVASTGGSRGGTAGYGVGVTPWQYGLTQIEAIGRYLQLSFWPHPLVFDYGVGLVADKVSVLLPALFLACLLAGTAVALARRSGLGFIGAWFFLTLAPSSSLLPVATQTMAEHRMYLALAAVVTLVVLGGRALVRRWILPAGVGIACLLAALTVERNRVYATSLSLWSDTAAARPANQRARNNLGVALLRAGRASEAIRQFRAALEIDPDFAEAREHLGDALCQEGNDLLRSGRAAEAIASLSAALRIRPDLAEAHNDLGSALSALPGRTGEAIAQFEEAVRLKPTYAGAHNNLGNLLAHSGRMAEAIVHFHQALHFNPDLAGAHTNLGIALAESGHLAEAAPHFAEAVRLEPANLSARRNLAFAFVQLERLPEAIAQFEELVRLAPDDPKMRQALADLRRAAGRPEGPP